MITRATNIFAVRASKIAATMARLRAGSHVEVSGAADAAQRLIDTGNLLRAGAVDPREATKLFRHKMPSSAQPVTAVLLTRLKHAEAALSSGEGRESGDMDSLVALRSDIESVLAWGVRVALEDRTSPGKPWALSELEAAARSLDRRLTKELTRDQVDAALERVDRDWIDMSWDWLDRFEETAEIEGHAEVGEAPSRVDPRRALEEILVKLGAPLRVALPPLAEAAGTEVVGRELYSEQELPLPESLRCRADLVTYTDRSIEIVVCESEPLRSVTLGGELARREDGVWKAIANMHAGGAPMLIEIAPADGEVFRQSILLGESEHVTVRATARGKVQGVHYRASLKQRASQLGLAGWVRNTEDKDKVEFVVQGAPDAVDALLLWARRGPQPTESGADPIVLEVEDEPEERLYVGFEVRP